jgi:hypothetical protein
MLSPALANMPVRAASMREPRVVYPYSVIKGGAWSAAGLTQALAVDPVAAAHYTGFRISAARLARLERARVAYVSYRVDNAVFWTRKPVTLPEGEAVLTDGENLARARCGNRISFTARQPAGPEVDLDTPDASPGEWGQDADRIAEVFDVPRLGHNVFPPYFDHGFAATAAGGLGGGPGASVASEGAGFARGFGAGGIGGGLALLHRDPVSGVSGAPVPASPPPIERPPSLPGHTAPIFIWTSGSTLYGAGPSGAGTPLPAPAPSGSGFPYANPPYTNPQGSTFPTAGGNGSGSGDLGGGNPPVTPPDDLLAPPEGPGLSRFPGPIPQLPPLLPALLPRGDLQGAPDNDVPEPATALLLAAGVLALTVRRAISKLG